jgi:predicted dehydrogenase
LRLAAVCDVDPARAAQVAARFDLTPYTDYAAMPADPAVTARDAIHGLIIQVAPPPLWLTQ